MSPPAVPRPTQGRLQRAASGSSYACRSPAEVAAPAGAGAEAGMSDHDRPSGGAAISPAERRWPLFASCLQTRRLAASAPLPRLATITAPLGAGGSAALIAETKAREEVCKTEHLHMQSRFVCSGGAAR